MHKKPVNAVNRLFYNPHAVGEVAILIVMLRMAMLTKGAMPGAKKIYVARAKFTLLLFFTYEYGHYEQLGVYAVV